MTPALEPSEPVKVPKWFYDLFYALIGVLLVLTAALLGSGILLLVAWVVRAAMSVMRSI